MGVLIKPSGKAIDASIQKQILASAFIIGATNPERDFRLPTKTPEFIKLVNEFTLEIIKKNHSPDDPESKKYNELKTKSLTKIMANAKTEAKLLQAAQDGLTFATEREKVIDKNAKGYSQKTKIGTGAVVGSALTSFGSTILEMYTAYPLVGGVALGIAGLSLLLNKPVREAIELTKENISRARKESYIFSTTTLRSLIKEKAYLNTALVNSRKREKEIIFKAGQIYKDIEKADKDFLKSAYTQNEQKAAGLTM